MRKVKSKMVYIVLGVVFLFVGGIFLLSFNVSKNSEDQFTKNAYFTQGTVVGRKLYSVGYMDEYYISVIDKSGIEKEYLSQSFRPTVPSIEPGTVIEVALAEKSTLGIKTYELQVVDERYAKQSSGKVSSVLLVVSIMFFVAACAMFALKFVL